MGKDQKNKKHGLDIRENRKLRAAKVSPLPPPVAPRRQGKRNR
jgi:hypothetical protein